MPVVHKSRPRTKIDPHVIAWLDKRRRTRLAVATRLLAGLLSNPDISRLDSDLFKFRGIGHDHRRELVELANEMAGELIGLVERGGG